MLEHIKVLEVDQFQLALSQVAPAPMQAVYCLKSGNWLHDFADALNERSNMSLSRRQEFTSGRHCATQALRNLGAPLGAPLVPDKDGIPLWPKYYIGSISHCKEQVVAVAARTDAISCVGIDIENVHRLSQAAIQRILSDSEKNWVEGSRILASLVFSAKEALFKAFYPRYRRTVNFQDVCLLPIPDTQCLKVHMNSVDFPVEYEQLLGNFIVRYTFIDVYVLCCCYLINPSFIHNKRELPIQL